MLKKVYNLHIAESKANRASNSRRIESFVKEFKLTERIPKLSKELVHVVISKVLRNKYCEFRDFIEILYQFAKLMNKDNNENTSKGHKLKSLVDQLILPTFKLESLRFFENNGENIQIFYDKYKVFSNPTVLLFCECDDLIKHVDSCLCFDNFAFRFFRFTKFSTSKLLISHSCRSETT